MYCYGNYTGGIKNKNIAGIIIRGFCLTILAFFFLITPAYVFAAAIPTNQLHMPMGASSPTANGDYVSASSGGLNTYYSYFIEVPPGLSRLVIDIFDADIGMGADEATAGPRDRRRGTSWDTSTTYSLIDPSGTARPVRFTTGNSTSPAGSDNTWLNFYNGTGHTVRDNFGAASYSNNNGTNNWSAAWIETDTGGAGPSAGNIQITGGELRIAGNTGNMIEREANLSSTGLNLASAYLTFSYRTSSGLRGDDCVSVYVSGNGGAGWTQLEQFCGVHSATAPVYNITSYISPNTRIRFAVSNRLENNEFYYFDNVEINDGGPITAGHWELRVDMGANDDINGFGVRANDGDSSASGTELNIYADSFLEMGLHSDTPTKTFRVYPYITNGCTFDSNDFDGDSAGSILYTSRTGSFTSNVTGLSGNDIWRNFPMTAKWTTDIWSADYGIWSSDVTVNRYDPNAGNYVTYYIGSYAAANPPPTAQPQVNSFRIYMPNDAVSAPAKPLLTQTLSHVSGPNPPAVGSTSKLKVQVTFFNPTAFPISFSGAGNMIRATVPGSGVVYAGNAAVSQGSVTSQPAVGGTGNIVWNPGTVTAGSSVDIVYEVNATPTLSGQRLPVTGTPALNGTIAVYIDETGNTTQTRATYTFGPLCELAVTAGGSVLPTLASISSFGVYVYNGKVLLDWDTASETGTAGFYVYRKDEPSGEFIKINDKLIPGLISSPQGGSYTYIDSGALTGKEYTYLLEEIEQRGGKRLNGPFIVTALQKYNKKVSGSYMRVPHSLSNARKAHLETVNKEKLNSYSMKEQAALSTKVKIAIDKTGLYYIPNTEIAPLLGTTPAKVASFIKKKMLRLTNNASNVAYTPSSKNSGIYFYGEGNSSIYTRDNIYWLEYNSGSVMEIVKGRGPAPSAGSQTFTELYTAEEDKVPAEALFTSPGDDYWFWDFIVADDENENNKAFAFNLYSAANSATFSFSARMYGGTDTSHHAIISINGIEAGEAKWEGITPYELKLSINASVLHNGENTVEVKGVLDNNVPYSIFYIDSFNLNYQSYYIAHNNKAVVRGNNNPVNTVEGFTAGDIKVYNITDRRNPKQITAVTISKNGADFSASFAGGSGENTYLALTGSAVQHPSAIYADIPSNLKNSSNSADYLVITVPQLSTAAGELAAYRQGKGLQTMLVLQEDIMDEFNYGNYSPEAIRNFLIYTYGNWAKYPRFVVLAGEGNDDYRNNQGFGGNLIPPIMTGSPDGLFPSDNYFADINNDHIPEMAVGRLPVGTADELRSLVSKMTAYENSSGSNWKNKIILLADNPDEGGDFTADSNSLGGIIPQTYSAEKIYLSEHSSDDTRQLAVTGINNGAVLLNYLGHAAIDRLAQEGILVLNDITSMNNQEKLPVVTAMTCVLGNYSIAGADSLGTEMLLRQNGGASAIFSPTGMSINAHALALGKSFYKSYFENRGQALGTIVLQALSAGKLTGVSDYMLDIYNILGDPALQIK